MLFDKAKEDHSAGKISLDDLAQAWLDETKLCYAKHGGQVTHMIDFAEPYHWTFFVASNNNDMFGKNYGGITIPCINVPPETAALALIAYEKVISRRIWEFNADEMAKATLCHATANNLKGKAELQARIKDLSSCLSDIVETITIDDEEGLTLFLDPIQNAKNALAKVRGEIQ